MAPAFGLTLRFARRERALLALSCAAAAAAFVAWIVGHTWAAFGDGPSSAMLQATGALAGALPAAWLGWGTLPAAACRLTWDAGRWQLYRDGDDAGADLQVEAEPMIDLGVWMLLRLHVAAGSCRWLVADAEAAGAHWHALRAALYLPSAPAPGAPTRPGGPGR